MENRIARAVSIGIFAVGLALSGGPTAAGQDVASEALGIETVSTSAVRSLSAPDLVRKAEALRLLRETGLLLIPESTNDRVMAFNATTGDLLDPDFIPADPTHLSTPIQAILSADGNSILVSDQINDVVQEYGLDGSYIGIFAPAGGVDNAILDNIRGITLRPNGNLLVTVAAGANADAIAEFDTSGNYLGNFVANGAGGLDSPFDVIHRPASSDYLSGGIDSDTIHRFDLNGAPLSDFAAIDGFPEQIAMAQNGNVLVGNFSGTQEGVAEYNHTGALIDVYNPAGVGANRGVYELPNGNILTTNGSGVHEIDRSGVLVETKISGVSARFIEFVRTGESCGPLVNCSFETGDFTGWVASDLVPAFFPLRVGVDGDTSFGGFFLSEPTDGRFAALHGFDGEGPSSIILSQDATLHPLTATLEVDFRGAWDLATFGATLDRTFRVQIEPLGGGPAMQNDVLLTAQVGEIVNDTDPLTATVDISAFGGSDVRLSFEWIVPESFSGPAFFQLDNVRVNECPVNRIVGVCASRPTQTTGDSLTVAVSLWNRLASNPSLSAPNLAIPDVVDFYFGALLPDGNTIVFFDPMLTPSVGALSDLTTLAPIASAFSLSAEATIVIPDLLTHTWDGSEPAGTYLLFLAAVVPGAFADGTIDPGDLVDLSTTPVSFSP